MLVFAIAASGCAGLPEQMLTGFVPVTPLLLGAEAPGARTTDDPAGADRAWAQLSVAPDGTALLNQLPLDLDPQFELAEYGIGLADLDRLPREWWPHYAESGDLLVVAISRASPLSLAGIEPLMVLHEFDGASCASAAQTIAALSNGPSQSTHRMHFVGPRREQRVEIAGSPGYQSLDRFDFPFVWQQQSCALGGGFVLANGIVSYHCALEHARPGLPITHVEATRASFLLGLYQHESWRDVDAGQRLGARTRTTLLWFIHFDSGSEGDES